MPPINFDRVIENVYNRFVKPAELVAKCVIDAVTKPVPQAGAAMMRSRSGRFGEETVQEMVRNPLDLHSPSGSGKSRQAERIITSYCKKNPQDSFCVRIYVNKSIR